MSIKQVEGMEGDSVVKWQPFNFWQNNKFNKVCLPYFINIVYIIHLITFSLHYKMITYITSTVCEHLIRKPFVFFYDSKWNLNYYHMHFLYFFSFVASIHIKWRIMSFLIRINHYLFQIIFIKLQAEFGAHEKLSELFQRLSYHMSIRDWFFGEVL